MPAEASAQSPDFLAKLQPGTKLAGCYLLKRRVEGTTHPLWIAHDEVLGKDIALQFILPAALARGGAVEHLRQEVKRARQFVHPRVPRVNDLIEEGEWTAVAMDAFEGRPLAAAMAENTHGFFEIAEVLPLARELCETLDAAHQVRLVHGGLSAGDVIVGGGQARVIGFGIGAALRGEGASATAADDVFALGVLLHTLLAGAPPFEGATRKGAPTISEHRRALKHRGGEVPASWERAIANCLAEDPAARPSSCGEILRMLEGAAPSAPAAPPVVVPPTISPAAAEAKPPSEPPPPAAPEPPVEPPVAEPTKEPEKEAPAPKRPAAEEPEPKPEPEPEPERPVSSKPRVGAHERGVVPVDPEELAAKVRREEAEEEARQLGGLDEDEAFYERSHGSGPSMLTLVILVAFAAIVAFICYQVFFAKSSRSDSRSVSIAESATPDPTPVATRPPATPVQTPVVKVAAATPTPASTTPKPAPIAVATPQPTPQPTPTPPMPVREERPVAAAADDPKELEAAIAEMKQSREKTSKELPAARKAADELDKQQKKLADDLKKAEMAAQEAEKAAAEKMKLAEDARKAAAAVAEQWSARRSEVTKAEEQLAKLELDLKEKERALAGAKAAAAAAKGARPAAPEKPMATATPPPTPAKPEAAPTSDDPRVAFEQKMKELSKVLDAGAAAKPATPPPVIPKAPTDLAKATTPAPERAATGFMNSLGMRFVPLPDSDVLVCIWPTRVRDFEAFARASGLKSRLWQDPGFKQTPDHPVVNVTWQEALAFCKWLTARDQKEGLISAKQSYRLLSDLEWSRAAGLSEETGATPEARDMGVSDVYPWGKAWPPPTGAGNYTGEETGSEVAIKGYDDGFPWTSPVGSFPPNKLGLYDMGGNVWQWCMDSWNAESKAKVLRGASWYNGALRLSLLTSCRVHASPDSSTDNYGFRVALSAQENRSAK